MSIQKKSLISALKTTKKANVAEGAKGEKLTSMKLSAHSVQSAKKFANFKELAPAKVMSAKKFASAKQVMSAKKFASAKQVMSAKKMA